MVIEGAEPKVEEIKDDFQIPFSIESLVSTVLPGVRWDAFAFSDCQTS